jgi:RNA recognition motif-containing protein
MVIIVCYLGLYYGIDKRPEGLKEYFTQFGKVDACTIMRDPTGRSRCFAFLTFEEPASVNKVMAQEHYLDGKVVRTAFVLDETTCNVYHRILRSILNVLYLVRNIREQQSCSSVD